MKLLALMLFMISYSIPSFAANSVVTCYARLKPTQNYQGSGWPPVAKRFASHPTFKILGPWILSTSDVGRVEEVAPKLLSKLKELEQKTFDTSTQNEFQVEILGCEARELFTIR